MSVTNYYSVGGRLLGEQTAGSGRLDYLTDALGSVTATVDQTGSVQNTYRYKPYGSQLAKTGTAPDPAFTWVGSQGYRQTGRKYSDVYVRARHYGSGQGRWTTSDPLRVAAGLGYYQYCQSNPATTVDPSGLMGIMIVVAGTVLTNCGSAYSMVSWGPFQRTDKGYVIQHVKRQPAVNLCDCGTCSTSSKPAPANSSEEYWEAWQVLNGQLCIGVCNGHNRLPQDDPNNPYADSFQTIDEGASCGRIQITGHVKFIPGYHFDPTVWQHNSIAGDLPSRTSYPGWSDTGTQLHQLTVSFNCCGSRPYPRETISTVP